MVNARSWRILSEGAVGLRLEPAMTVCPGEVDHVADVAHVSPSSLNLVIPGSRYSGAGRVQSLPLSALFESCLTCSLS